MAGCGQQVALPPTPIASAPVQTTTGAIPKQIEVGAADSLFVVSGSPTDTYSALARGAHGCWFGANGPLKRSHVFHAEANPPAKGGAAEILVQERDALLSDQRGERAFRVALIPSGEGTQVAVSRLKLEAQAALAMTRDVEAWSRGSQGCQLRTVLPPLPDPVPEKKVAGKSKPGR
jgi:hypothetical protein